MKNNLPDKQSNFLLYTGNDGKVNVEVFLKDETIWLTQKAISQLYGVQRSAITNHLKNIFNSGELQEGSVSSILEHTASDELEEKSNVQKMHFGQIFSSFNSLSDRKKLRGTLR